VSRRQFAIADCVVALALVAIAFIDGGVGAALLIASVLGLGHGAAWYSLRTAGSSSPPGMAADEPRAACGEAVPKELP
jgi:hypothetical protein